jgi:hypothetical protein
MSSSSPERIRLAMADEGAVDDPVLARLDKAARAKEQMFRTMGASKKAEESDESDAKDGYDVEVVRPRAVDVRKLARLTGATIPSDVEATLGGRVPVLLHHGMTPFNRKGRSPQEVWGMGYEVELVGGDGDTHSIAPQTQILKVGEWKQRFNIGVSAGGRLGAPTVATQALAVVPKFELEGAQVQASTDQQFALMLGIELNFLEVQAGPKSPGGARWNLYRQHERLDRFQPLFQTLLLAKGTKNIELKISTWVRRSGFLGTSIGAREWVQKPVRHVVSLEGLES